MFSWWDRSDVLDAILAILKGDTVAHHRENRFPMSALAHAKNSGKWVSTLFPPSSLHKNREMEWRMWHKVGMHCTELKLREIKNSKKCITEISGISMWLQEYNCTCKQYKEWHQGKEKSAMIGSFPTCCLRAFWWDTCMRKLLRVSQSQTELREN